MDPDHHDISLDCNKRKHLAGYVSHRNPTTVYKTAGAGANLQSGIGIGVEGRDKLDPGEQLEAPTVSEGQPRRSAKLRALRWVPRTEPIAGDRRDPPTLMDRLLFNSRSCSFNKWERGDLGSRWRGVDGCEGVVGVEQSKPITTRLLRHCKPSTGVLCARTTSTLRPLLLMLKVSSHMVATLRRGLSNANA